MKTEKQNAAIARITEQMMKDPEDAALVALEEYFTEICITDTIADKLLADGKTLSDAFDAIKNYARKNQKNGCCYVAPEKAFEICDEYYGITEADKKSIPKINDAPVDILSQI